MEIRNFPALALVHKPREFKLQDFGISKTKGEDVYYLTGGGHRNVLAKPSLLETSQSGEVRY